MRDEEKAYVFHGPLKNIHYPLSFLLEFGGIGPTASMQYKLMQRIYVCLKRMNGIYMTKNLFLIKISYYFILKIEDLNIFATFL